MYVDARVTRVAPGGSADETDDSMNDASRSSLAAPASAKTPYAVFALALAAALVALRYLILGPDAVVLLSAADDLFARVGSDTGAYFAAFAQHQRPTYRSHSITLLLHITCMSVALVAGAWQFVPGTRHRAPRAHRVVGWVYVPSALTGLVSGAQLAVALPMIGSPIAVASNVAAGVLGSLFVLLALRNILRGEIASHGRFMLRSYAVLTTLLTLYAMVALFVLAGIPAATGYEAAHDLCLPFNMALVELLLLSDRRRRSRAPRTGARQ